MKRDESNAAGQPKTCHAWRLLLLGGIVICQTVTATVVAPVPKDIPDITIRMAGSTIQDNNLTAVLKNICLGGAAGLSTFADADATGQGTYWKAWFCAIDNSKLTKTAISQQNPRLLIQKRNKNGAITGVYPLLENKPIQFMEISNGNCTVSSGTAYTCRTSQTGDLGPYVPDAGMLDVDPRLLRDANFMPYIDDQVFHEPTSQAILDHLEITNAGAIIQNTPVSKNLRDSLQAAQIARGILPDSCTVGDETAACMPSLDKSTLARLFAGEITSWSDITVNVAGVDHPLTDYAQGASLTNTRVHLCRRNLGASTQAAMNAYFLDNPCHPTGKVPVAISNPGHGPVVVWPAQVSQEETCLDNFSKGTVGTFNPAGDIVWALGMLTTERNKTRSFDYRYISIDGVVPTVQNVFSGTYPYFSEAAYVWRKVDPQPSGDKLALLTEITYRATTPTMFGTLNSSITQSWGTGSYIATTGQTGYTAPQTFDPVHPLSPYTHQPTGTDLDNCHAIVKQ